jgi:SAM-dependent methyltransferase
MLLEEAKWFSHKISLLNPQAIFPMLNVGSSTEKFRRVELPWIDQYIFRPFREKKYPTVHLDIREGPGVDIVGDLSDPQFLEKMARMNFRSVFCANVFEHVPHREDLGRALTRIVSSGGYLFVSCPYQYPFHADPIDTMFRPNVNELARLFPQASILFYEIVTDRTYLYFLTRKPAQAAPTILLWFLPFVNFRGWRTAVNHIPWLFRNFQETCLVLQK